MVALSALSVLVIFMVKIIAFVALSYSHRNGGNTNEENTYALRKETPISSHKT